MEPLSAQLTHYILAGIFAVLAFYLRKAIKKLDQQENTRVKANLCFDDLTERKPEMSKIFRALMGKNGA